MTSETAETSETSADGGLPVEGELSVTSENDGTFTGRNSTGSPRVFGGMLLGQALRVAQSSVAEGRHPHSLQASFLRAPDGTRPIHYAVEETRTGGSFSTRRVTADQGDGIVFIMTAGFQPPEEGLTWETSPLGEVPAPETLGYGRYSTPWFESRDVPRQPGALQHARQAWFRARLPLPDDLLVHAQALAFLSDHGPTRAIRQPFDGNPALEQRHSVTLQHSLWFRSPARIDGWLLSEYHPVFAGGGRGLAFGTIRRADGTLLAAAAQEALLRVPD